MKLDAGVKGGKSFKKPVFGTPLVQLNGENEDASRLVGGIIEKGSFSVSSDTPAPSCIPPPRPTALPFPVARHRSHGPHWTSVGGGSFSGDDRDMDDTEEGEEKGFSGFDSLAAFAKPVPRRKREGLDLSRWRDIMGGEGDSSGERKHVVVEKSTAVSPLAEISDDSLEKSAVALAMDLDTEGKNSVDFQEMKEQLSDLPTDLAQQKNTADVHVAQQFLQMGGTSRHRIAETEEDIISERGLGLPEILGNEMEVDRQSVDESEALNLESQIDAENRTRIGRMSSKEIAEAQAEIMAKMSPALIEALKKRGQDKLKKKKCPRSDKDKATTAVVGTLQDESILFDAHGLPHSDSSDRVIETGSKETWMKQGNEVGPGPSPKNSSFWDSWSKRVETVREIRFSLDGNMIKFNVLQATNTGSTSAGSQYTVNNVAERDLLRTEGDPGAVGYTIKEAVALTRSVVPGQRALALHLVAAILNRAIHGICKKKVGYSLKYAETDGDWEAIWAFSLGPEPELALSLRICLDDNHNSVVLSCAKAIQSMLSFDLNENLFDTSEKAPSTQDDIPTAAVFRSKPEIDVGFLHGSFWKYSTKPINILPLPKVNDDNPEGEHTIQDDVVVSGQDVAAGLVRMGILPRIRYLLETQSSASLEECLLSILVAVARHSPTSATAIMTCHRLVQTVINRFLAEEQMEINPSKIKCVILLKVLARTDKKNCLEFINSGIFQKVTWHLVRYMSLDQWINSGKEVCKLSSNLLVEQLRLWKVCITYGYCVSYFADLFPALSIWLNVPTFQKLLDRDVLGEFVAVSREVYLVLEALTKRLPNFYSSSDKITDGNAEEMESWCWSYVGPLIDLALDWTVLKNITPLSRFIDWQNRENEDNMLQDSVMNSLLWVISSALHTICSVLEAVIPADTSEFSGGCLPWLPEFVPKVGLKLIKSGYFHFSGADVCDFNVAEGGSFVKFLCHLRYKCGLETAIASSSCLQGLIQIISIVDKLIRLANPEIDNLSSEFLGVPREDKILADGILKSSVAELKTLLASYMKFTFKRPNMQSIEMFGRGGPAPGTGVGWGASGGGFWSKTVLLAQVDARLITRLLEIFQNFCVNDQLTVDNLPSFLRWINTAMEVCLTAGPRDRSMVDKIFDLLFQVPVLRCLEFVIYNFLHVNKMLKVFEWKYEEEDYLLFCGVLAAHFKSRWLSVKKKSRSIEENQDARQKMLKKGNFPLETIDEEMSASYLDNTGVTTLTNEWAYQRLPLPAYWFLSPMSNMCCSTDANVHKAYNTQSVEQEQAGLLRVAQAGLFFLLGLEATSAFLSTESYSSVHNVSVTWKLHALSVILIDGTGVLEDEKSRDVYQTLQSVYGQTVDKRRLSEAGDKINGGLLQFQLEINESYSTFLEMLVEQFAAVSYGDLVFGRQIAVYLHRWVEAPVRLATWNALSNAHALELLPPLEQCFAEADGYLEPVEDDEKLLEAYVKSWVSGVLDKAATRRSSSYILVLHHLTSFIFGNGIGDKLSLRNQLVKSLLRDFSRKVNHQGMMMNLLQYEKPTTGSKRGLVEAWQVEKRLVVLRDACGGNSLLLNQVEKLDQALKKEESAHSVS
ncbi:transcriptional elongation regulator MINIYO-like [Coffea arabica]|uniref:Transcriptional elongation regulator MINIYO-like n=1 Tax=Coffea arabica TaxID=13443 RepID=A0ABM4UR28_COFAR